MYLFVAALLVVADQLSKLWVVNTFPLNGSGRYVGLGFYFTYVRNTGAAFGIFQNNTLVLGILSAVVSVLLAVYLWRRARETPALQNWALTLILAGAFGNMIDRFWLGYVRDFIHFQIPSFNFAVFNIADSCVVVGAGLLLFSSFFIRERPAPRPLETPAPEANTETYPRPDLDAKPLETETNRQP